MWNRFISSPYAHLVTAVAVTFGLVLVLLTAHPRKAGIADVTARNIPASGASLASESNVRTDSPAEASSIRLMQDRRTTGTSP